MRDPMTGIDPDIPLDRVVSSRTDDDAPMWVQLTAMALMLLIAGIAFYAIGNLP